MKGRHLAARVIGVLAAVLADVGAAGAAGGVVLDQDGYWRRYYRFAVSRLSPGALKADGLRVLGRRGMARYQRDTERRMRRAGIDPAKADWRDHVDLAPGGARAFNPHPTPPPPAGWAAADFDDSGWLRARRPFQGGQAASITSPALGQYDESVDLRHRAGYYRGRFVVDDPQNAGAMTVRLVYCGGARVLLNGREIARGHLPPGPLAADTPGAGYPAAAYKPAGATLRRRTIGPVRIAPAILRKGVNVLAVEVRASDFHPIVLTHPTQPNWGGPQRPFPHARFVALELRSTSPAARSGGRRPSGVQVWAEDMHHRCDTDDVTTFECAIDCTTGCYGNRFVFNLVQIRLSGIGNKKIDKEY